MTEHGASVDAWPALWERVQQADILVLATPIWLGDASSVFRRVIERLYSESSELNEHGQSLPYGKVAGMLIHHTNLAEATPDRRKLVCYDCGVACDLTKMREDRLVALRTLNATDRPAGALPIVAGDRDGMVDVSERGGGSPARICATRSTG